MDKRRIYSFRIDVLSPDTLSMKDLAKYLSDLAELIGEERHVHFDRVKEGSAQLDWWPEEYIEPIVRSRLESVPNFLANSDIHDAVLNLNRRLANDNASAVMIAPDNQTVAEFPGVSFKQFKDVPAFWQADRLRGRLIRIGGKDSTIHAHIDMGGKVISNITLDESLAREIVKYFLGPTLALNGKAKWQRDYLGNWKLLSFSVHSFDVLRDLTLEQSIDEVGSFLTEGIGRANDLYADRSSDEAGESD